MMAETLRAPLQGEPAASPKWYACFTRARAEKRVAELLSERGVETFLPLVSRMSQWKDRRKAVDWPMFPSYVFGRFDLRDAHIVLATPGVVALVKAAGRPIPIDEAELENVRRFVAVLRSGALEVQPKPAPYFTEGEWVEVVDGPLAGLRGVVVESRGRRRILIGLHAIGQGMDVHIDPRVLRSIPDPRESGGGSL
jgi:transcription antitermination factor NusG